MGPDYNTALSRLITVQAELNRLNLAESPREMQLALLKAQQTVYEEIQALQAVGITGRNQDYAAITVGFQQSEAGFRKIHSLAQEAERTGKVVEGLMKGLSLVFSLL